MEDLVLKIFFGTVGTAALGLLGWIATTLVGVKVGLAEVKAQLKLREISHLNHQEDIKVLKEDVSSLKTTVAVLQNKDIVQ